MAETITWTEAGVKMINQLLLPHEELYFIARDHKDVAKAIKDMIIRGAPAIGVAAAMGVALGMKNYIESEEPGKRCSSNELIAHFKEICDVIIKSRPTAVNLQWAINKMNVVFYASLQKGTDEIKNALIDMAITLHDDDIRINKLIGKHGAELIQDGYNVMTHCNAGALATAGYGTAVGVIKTAFDEGKSITVYVNETRPYLQGARLTAWEMVQNNIPAFLITDNMAGYIMKLKKIDCVIVGADRITADGDTANKIGTYSLAILANFHNIPFYIAAPTSTIDTSISSGDDIPIEWRSSLEVKKIFDRMIAPEKIDALHPAFDVTPAFLISAIITEHGILRKPFTHSIASLFADHE